MITVNKLVKRFGLKTVLRGVDFDVQPGEFVALLGPNGAGKTTFLRILASPSWRGILDTGYTVIPDTAQARTAEAVVFGFCSNRKTLGSNPDQQRAVRVARSTAEPQRRDTRRTVCGYRWQLPCPSRSSG